MTSFFISIKQGYILTSEIDGTIQMKSYLTGNPEIRLALNEDLSIGRTGSSYGTSLAFPLTTSLGNEGCVDMTQEIYFSLFVFHDALLL
jgi:hypothetical protein